MTKNRRHDIVKPSKFKTSMCTFFLSPDGCPFGDKCAFAHGDDELRSPPKDAAATGSGAPPDAAAATSSPTSSHDSDLGEGHGAGEKSSPKQHGHHDANAPMSASASAKRKSKKNRMDASSGPAAPASSYGGPGGRADLTQIRCRPQRDRRPLPPPPPPMQSQGPMPSAAYNLSVAPAPPSAYALYGDLSMAYGGIPAMSGMPYYIPTVGNHPFSVINNNHHAINVVPHMQSPMSYPPSAPPPPSFPPPPPQATPTPQSSVPSPPQQMNAAHHVASVVSTNNTNTSNNNNNSNSTTSAEDAKRRPRQAMRHVVSSNTMAHSHGRHAANVSSAPAEIASPQYVYGLMAAAGMPMNGGSPMPPATTAATTATTATPPEHQLNGNGTPTAVAAPPNSQQPRLIVVPHKSGSGGFVVPSNIKNYHPNASVEPASTFATPQNSPVLGGSGTANTAAAAYASVSRADDASTAVASVQPSKNAAAPPTVVHIPLNGSGSGGAARTVGDALWGPAGGSVNPLTSSSLQNAASDDAGRDYNALLSGLGIGGSSYTTIPLEELVRQRGPTRDDDDASFGGDFDWTGAFERWLHTAKEDGTAATAAAPSLTTAVAKAAPATVEAPVPAATASASATAALLPQASQPVTSALYHKPVLMEGETKPRSTTAEIKRKPAAVCQVSRAGGKPAPPRRRAPVMTNQFKSSCAAEAESGSVLLYCAEKNTLVYITSANTAANAKSSRMESVTSNGESDAAAEGTHARAASLDSPTTAASSVSLGLGVRFNPGRKKHSVLEPEAGDNDAEYCI